MYLPGERVNVGIGGESAAARGTGVAPSIWLPGRTPSGLRLVLDKVLIRETKGVGVANQGSEIVQKRGEGDHEFNVKSKSIGWILQSLLGSSASVAKSSPNGAVYDHTFSLVDSPQHPSLTLALAAANHQDYEFTGAVVNSLEIRTPVDDLVNATVNFIARGEATHADYTVAWGSDDYHFRQQDIVIKIATDVSGLAGASALGVKEFSLTLNGNAKPDQNIGSLSPQDVFSMLLEISGSLKIDYQGTTYHDIFATGGYRAMRIEMTRSDVTIGSSANPKLVIDLPRVSFEDLAPDRPLDDLVRDGISFTAHYDNTEASAISVVLTNTLTTYTVA